MRLIKHFFIFIILLFTFGCSNEEKIMSVDYIKFQKDFNKKEFYGRIKAQNSSLLSFQAEGKINYLPYTKGDFIKKGDVIARLDGTLYSIKKSEEQAKLERFIIEQNKQKSSYKRLSMLHKEGAISDNDWENAYYELKTLDKDINSQKEKIKYIEKEISYNILQAPYDGYIAEKLVDVDSYVKIGTPVINFISSSGVQVEIMVNEDTINELKLNNSVQIKVQNSIYQGKIEHISKSSINSGGYLIKISINASTDKLKEGMSAIVELNSDNEIATLPLNCIFEENNQKFIYKIINIKNEIGEIKKENITTGKIINDKIEILKGIKENDIVIIGNFIQNPKIKKVRLWKKLFF